MSYEVIFVGHQRLFKKLRKKTKKMNLFELFTIENIVKDELARRRGNQKDLE